MEINELKAKIKSGELTGWYIFAGEEDYLKKYYLNTLRAALITDEVFAPFNHSLYDGADVDFASVAEDIKSPPMMSDYKLIEWRFANLDILKEGERGALEGLFELKEAHPYAVFVIMTTQDGFDTGSVKKPSKLASRLSRGFDILNFPKSTEAQLISWLKKHFDAEGVATDAQTLGALVFRSGRSMDVLNQEVVKLSSYVKANGRSALTIEDVEYIASPTVECDAFALSNAVTDRSVERAFLALADLKQRRVEPLVILSMLERTYSELASVALMLEEGRDVAYIERTLKFHPFKARLCIGAAKKSGVKRLTLALSELCRLDAAAKSGASADYGTIEAFIIKSLK